jgi:hypothetical protein
LATARKAAERFAEATGIPLATTLQATRILQNARLWPRGGQGGGPNQRHVSPPDLVNLMLAVVSSPMADAPAFIAELRGMVPPKEGEPIMGGGGATFAEDAEPFLPGDTLGDTLDAYVAAVAENPTAALEHLFVRIIGHHNGLPDWVETAEIPERSCMYVPPRWVRNKAPAARIGREITIGSSLLGVLAELYADTLAYRAQQRAAKGAEALPGVSAPNCRTAQGHTTGPHPEPTPDGPSSSTQET